MVQCKACLATYEPIQRDGVRYFHTCAPLSNAEIKAALGLPVDEEQHTKEQAAQLAAASRVRPGARDENVTPGPRDPKTGELNQPGVPKFDGAGVVKL